MCNSLEIQRLKYEVQFYLHSPFMKLLKKSSLFLQSTKFSKIILKKQFSEINLKEHLFEIVCMDIKM